MIDIAIRVDGGAWPDEAELEAINSNVVEAVAAVVSPFPETGELSLLFTENETIAGLNAAWRGKQGPTNVLSFPAPGSVGGNAPVLGDIVLGFETVAKEAADMHLTLADHITHLIVHGLLHLLGYDHEDDAEAEAMEATEIRILTGLGIANPYAESGPARVDAGTNGQ